MFDFPLHADRIASFRSAMIEWAGREHDLLHNHLNPEANADSQKSGFSYRYPLVQYRSYKNNATLFALNEGADALGDVLAINSWQILFNGRPTQLRIADLKMREHHLVATEQPQTYYLANWMALNQQNYREWNSLNPAEQTSKLEQILTNNLVSVLRSFDAVPTERIYTRIVEAPKQRLSSYHGIRTTTFDVVFQTQMQLPNLLGIGKAVSHVYGVLRHHYTNRRSS